MPHSCSRRCIHIGDGAAGSKPVTRAQHDAVGSRSGRRSRTGCAVAVGVGQRRASAGSRNATPYAVAASRAMPRIERQ